MSQNQFGSDRMVVSKYVSNPLLINNHKFDLRIYVLLTCIEPLRIYVYNEGLVRFASEPYNNSRGSLKNMYQHLTNYSINKNSNTFEANNSVLERDHGNKWSLSALQAHFEKMGINVQPIWERIYDVIIKSILTIENHLQQGNKKGGTAN
jgi:tubulin polyglutamylase TTLL5